MKKTTCIPYHNKGLTLLETLLIIIIVGILAAITLTSYQKRSSISKIEKAAIEMQGIFQAASAFYLLGASPNPDTSNKWPAYEMPTQDMPAYFVEFLPILPATTSTSVRIKNPWGYYYTVDGSQGDRFRIQTQTPDSDTAKTLAGKLPFAGIDSNNNKMVYANVPVPGNSFGLTVKSIGLVKANSMIPIPQDCPFGTQPAITSAMNYIRSNLKNIMSYPSAIDKSFAYTIHIIGAPISYWNVAFNPVQENTYWQVSFSFEQANDCTSKGSCKDGSQGTGQWDGKTIEAKALYIVYCDPIKSIPKSS